MKPTVINNSNSEHSAKPNQEQNRADSTTSNNPNNNVGGGGGDGNDSRRFPQFRVSEITKNHYGRVCALELICVRVLNRNVM